MLPVWIILVTNHFHWMWTDQKYCFKIHSREVNKNSVNQFHQFRVRRYSFSLFIKPGVYTLRVYQLTFIAAVNFNINPW